MLSRMTFLASEVWGFGLWVQGLRVSCLGLRGEGSRVASILLVLALSLVSRASRICSVPLAALCLSTLNPKILKTLNPKP